MGIQVEEFSENVATKEDLIATKYNGTNSQIKGTSGEAYYDLQNKVWKYRPNGKGFTVNSWYRVEGKNLSCNNENGWLKCEYVGDNKLFGLSKVGKATFNEDVDSWIFKPKGAKEEFRVGEHSLRFERDVDVDNSAE